MHQLTKQMEKRKSSFIKKMQDEMYNFLLNMLIVTGDMYECEGQHKE